MSPEPPALLPKSGSLRVAGCDVRWYAGGSGSPTLLLVHGGGGHAGWWEALLPALTARQRVIALDLSGHGDSGHRADGYSTATWATEVAAVLEQVAGEQAAVIGHSMGGRIATMTAGRHPAWVSHLVTVDAVVPPQKDEPVPRVRPAKFYESETEILGAFRLKPPQPPAAPQLMDRLARRSILRCPDGRFTWKFDPAVFGGLDDRFVNADIPNIACPVTIVQGGASSLTTPEIAEQFQTLLGHEAETVIFPRAHHHVPLDAPHELERLLARLCGTRPQAAP